MRILVTGASGYLGSRTLRVLRSRGHRPLAFVRRAEAADALACEDFETVLGDLDEPASLVAAAESTDGVIHTAFAHVTDFALAVVQEHRAVGALIDAFEGTGERLVVATATGVLGDTGPEPVDDDFPGRSDFRARIRMAVEDDVRAAAARGVHGAVVRPAILVHGHGAGQFVPIARTLRTDPPRLRDFGVDVDVGLGALLERAPWMSLALRGVSAPLLGWIAWRVLTAGPLDPHDERPLLGWMGGAAFRWINPKAWAMTGSAVTLHLPPHPEIGSIAWHALTLFVVGTVLVGAWAAFGNVLRTPLASPTFARGFDAAMAALLLLPTLPMVLGTDHPSGAREVTAPASHPDGATSPSTRARPPP